MGHRCELRVGFRGSRRVSGRGITLTGPYSLSWNWPQDQEGGALF